MKKITVALAILLTTSCVTFAQTKPGKDTTTTTTTSSAKYTCTMHKDVVSDKPGKCPKCGMELVKMKPKKTKPKA